MKSIEKNELYEHLTGFLKNRGIHLTSGSYADGVKKGCSLLTDAINLSQKGIKRAQGGINETLNQMRQSIHEQTAPKNGSRSGAKKPGATRAKSKTAKAKTKRAKR